MTEERWHNFAKEKPSEDMEGRNFIVSNGHYEKIATWCGYWENEPFMGDHLCDEVVRWKFYFTPEEEKANGATNTEPKPMKCDELKQVEYPIEWGIYYDKSEVDAAIAELKARIQLDDDEMAGFLQLEEECGGGDLRNYIAELKAKLENVQASHYAESVDAGMRERRQKRALWLAREWRAWGEVEFWSVAEGDKPKDVFHLSCTKRVHRMPITCVAYWQEVARKCKAKAEEYK